MLQTGELVKVLVGYPIVCNNFGQGYEEGVSCAPRFFALCLVSVSVAKFTD